MIARLSFKRWFRRNLQKNVRYVLEKEEGPDHNKSFTTSAYIGEECYGTGSGRTKKASEQEAAYQTILMLRKKEQ